MEVNNKIIEEGLNQALLVAKQRNHILERLKQALLMGDDEKIKHYASQLCGLTNESH